MDKGRDQISQHEVAVFEAVRASGEWLTSIEIAEKAGVAQRTARAHAAAMAKVGLFDVKPLFGGYRYRVAPHPKAEAVEYRSQIETAKAVFGM